LFHILTEPNIPPENFCGAPKARANFLFVPFHPETNIIPLAAEYLKSRNVYPKVSVLAAWSEN
jgi:hypothetical protein